MKYIIFCILCITSSQSFAVTAESLAKEFYNILTTCKKIGFYKCQDEYFQGDTRGIFHLPIEKQKLKITEKEFNDFIKTNSKEGINASFFKETVNIDFKLEDKFDISRFSPNNINGVIQPLNPENTLFKFSFKNAPPIVLVYVNNRYKFGILPEQEKEFRESNDFKTAYIYKLKNNILRYHMKESEILNYDIYVLNKKVSEAQAPILFMLEKGKVPDFVKDYMGKKSMKDIQRFYMPLDTEDKIIQKIKETHKL